MSSGPYKVPKFLLGGVNVKQNFLGLGTMKTAVYGCIETAIKAAPIVIAIYGFSKELMDRIMRDLYRESNDSLHP